MIDKALYKPRITITVGDTGAGKSFFLYWHPAISDLTKIVTILDIERRWGEMIEHASLPPLGKNVTIHTPTKVKTNGDLDPIKTYENLQKEVLKIGTDIQKGKKVDLVIFDGISDVKEMAKDYYEAKNGPIGFKEWGKWGIVNGYVRSVYMNLVNLAREYKFQLYCTAMLTEAHEGSKAPEAKFLNGLQIDLKRDIRKYTDELAIIYIDKGERIYSRLPQMGAKSFYPAEEFIIEIDIHGMKDKTKSQKTTEQKIDGDDEIDSEEIDDSGQ